MNKDLSEHVDRLANTIFTVFDAIQKARSNEQDVKRNTSSSLTGLGGKTSIGDPNTIPFEYMSVQLYTRPNESCAKSTIG